MSYKHAFQEWRARVGESRQERPSPKSVAEGCPRRVSCKNVTRKSVQKELCKCVLEKHSPRVVIFEEVCPARVSRKTVPQKSKVSLITRISQSLTQPSCKSALQECRSRAKESQTRVSCKCIAGVPLKSAAQESCKSLPEVSCKNVAHECPSLLYVPNKASFAFYLDSWLPSDYARVFYYRGKPT